MNRVLIFTICLLSMTIAYAATEKSKFCPLLNQIHFSDSRLVGINADQKQFLSGPPCSFDCGPDNMAVLSFQAELTNYDAANQTLSCAYLVKVTENGQPDINKIIQLKNHGDY